jgi:hypothetical protein
VSANILIYPSLNTYYDRWAILIIRSTIEYSNQKHEDSKNSETPIVDGTPAIFRYQNPAEARCSEAEPHEADAHVERLLSGQTSNYEASAQQLHDPS